MRTITQEELISEMRRRFGDDARKWKFVCTICGTVQSAEDFYEITGRDGKPLFRPRSGEVNKYLGFSCIGRFTGAGPHKVGAPAGRGCDWTLGGLLRLHELEVVLPNGKSTPCFEIAEAASEAEVAA